MKKLLLIIAFGMLAMPLYAGDSSVSNEYGKCSDDNYAGCEKMISGLTNAFNELAVKYNKLEEGIAWRNVFMKQCAAYADELEKEQRKAVKPKPKPSIKHPAPIGPTLAPACFADGTMIACAQSK